ncbi:MAG: histidine ammonia-lyase, partial [Gemmatimonadetes bacterium]|nr:histidine ammonia-lyase [Gemmatimonadota bacterium]
HHAAEIVRNVTDVLAIGAICVAQAMDLRDQATYAPASRALHAALRTAVPFWSEDRYAAGDVQAAAELVRSGALTSEVEAVAGKLRTGDAS